MAQWDARARRWRGVYERQRRRIHGGSRSHRVGPQRRIQFACKVDAMQTKTVMAVGVARACAEWRALFPGLGYRRRPLAWTVVQVWWPAVG